MSSTCEVAIIGAGPYGLSLAAHLRARGVSLRIFGRPMWSWRHEMPASMHLKSEGFASNLFEPEGQFTLASFCAANKVPYRAWGLPVALQTMCAYGIAFQLRCVPELEERMVVAVRGTREGFFLKFDDGGGCFARRVVVAAGIGAYVHMPDVLKPLSRAHVTHSYGHSDLAPFKGRDVTILGAGSSALDLAGLMHQEGIAVRLVARRPSLRWAGEPLPEHRSLYQRLRYPMSGMAPGVRSRIYEDAPDLVRLLPRTMRQHIYGTFLGPAGPWWMKKLVEREVPLVLGRSLRAAEPQGEKLRLVLEGAKGQEEILTDHLIAATGFRIDVRKLGFFDDTLREGIATAAGVPVLSAHFQSSVPGLYFVGLAAAPTFGPLMRFMLGAGFAARRVATHVTRAALRERTTYPSEPTRVRTA
ncbi:MAG TPA: NAD(P)-binding domain-containing protein [Stellaceae bacterium]|nr:NAD(P)-binding domain-containing protein [Stellaceae bacterium]